MQKSERGIFPALSRLPARVAETALGSTDRPFLVTEELERSGRQGCWVNERWLKRTREVARPGSNVGHQSDGRHPGPTSLAVLTRRLGHRVLAWQERSPAQAGRCSARCGRWSSCPALLRDMGCQRSRRPVSLSQPKGAEGFQPPAGARRSAVLYRVDRGRSCGGEQHRSILSGGSGSANCAARRRKPTNGDDDARCCKRAWLADGRKAGA